MYEMPPAGAPVWPIGPPPWGPPQSPNRLGGLAWTAIAVAVGLVIAAVAFVALHIDLTVTKVQPLNSTASACQETAPASASPAGRAYINAVDSANPAWMRITQSLIAEHYIVGHSDLQDQAASDRTYIAAIQRINFPAVAAATARSYILVVRSYIAQLDIAVGNSEYYPSNHQIFADLSTERSALSGQLRSELGLPQSNCIVLRP